MAKFLKQSTASQEIVIGYLVDSTDGNTEETGLTIANTDIKLHKAGATTLANKNSGGATHISNGIYYAVLDATDTDTLGNLKVFVHVSGALAWSDSFVVLPANVYDSLVGTDKLEVDVAQWLGTAAATPTTAGVPEVDLTHIAGATVSTSTAQLGVNAVSLAADSITNTALATTAVTEIVNGILAGVIDGSYTVGDMLYLLGAALGGKVSGMDTNNPVFRNAADTANAISATTDANGNRTAVTLTLPL